MFMSLGICRTLATDSSIPSSKQLYRDLYRHIKQLPKQARLYYRNYTRQLFSNYNDESDPEVLRRLHDKARQDASWVVKKYQK